MLILIQQKRQKHQRVQQQEQTHKCSCGYSYTTTIAAKGHTRPTSKSDFTLISDTEHKYTCTTCSVEVIEGHSLSAWKEQKDPTCTEVGYKARYTCNYCGKHFDANYKQQTITIAALGHDFTKESATEEYLKTSATCTAKATYYKSCSRCGLSSKGQTGESTFESGNLVAHSYGTKVAAKAATCTAAGMQAYYKCSVCSNYFDSDKKQTTSSALTIAKLGHSYSTSWSNNETQHWKACTRSGCTAKSGTANHSYTKTTQTAATCTTKGTSKYTCSCGYSYTAQDIAKLEHSYQTSYQTNATHHWNKCENCIAETERVEHNYNQQTQEHLATEATYTAPATYYYTCVCGEVGSETYAYGEPMSHTYGEWVEEIPATCQSEGRKGYYYCSDCNKYFDKFNQEITDLTLAKLTHVYNQEVATEGYLKTSATCTAKATYYYSCVCGEKGTDTFEYGTTLAHVYNQEVATEEYLKTSATCTSKATYYYSCVCGEKGTDTFESGEFADHNYGTWIDEIPAQVGVEGTLGHYHCEVCNRDFDSEYQEITNLVIPALPNLPNDSSSSSSSEDSSINSSEDSSSSSSSSSSVSSEESSSSSSTESSEDSSYESSENSSENASTESSEESSIESGSSEDSSVDSSENSSLSSETENDSSYEDVVIVGGCSAKISPAICLLPLAFVALILLKFRGKKQ